MKKGKKYVSGSRHKKSSCYDVKHMKDDVITVNDGSRYPTDVIHFKRDRHEHSTQKPVDLLRWLIRTHCNRGAVILDNCAGSGSTYIAAHIEHCYCIAMERDPEIFSRMKRRVHEALAQQVIDFDEL